MQKLSASGRRTGRNFQHCSVEVGESTFYTEDDDVIRVAQKPRSRVPDKSSEEDQQDGHLTTELLSSQED